MGPCGTSAIVLAGDVVPGGRDEAIVIDPLPARDRTSVSGHGVRRARRRLAPRGGRHLAPTFFDLEEATIGDVDGDGLSDLILLNDVDFVDELWVMAADGRGGFDDPVRVWVGPRDEAPETFYGTADINRDGLDDLVATSRGVARPVLRQRDRPAGRGPAGPAAAALCRPNGDRRPALR